MSTFRWFRPLHGLLYDLAYPHPTVWDIHRSNGCNVRDVLLLGAGSVGKTTIHRQMRHLCIDEDARDIDTYLFSASNSMENCCNILRELLRRVINMQEDIAWTKSALSAAHRIVNITGNLSQPYSNDTDFLQLKDDLKTLWADPAMKRVFSEYQFLSISPTASYFLDKIDEHADEDYTPTMEDIVRQNYSTRGIDKWRYIVNGAVFYLYDVGGVHTERKIMRKWIHCFSEVNTVVFVVALHHFDRVLWEDESVNAMQESFEFFRSIMRYTRWKYSRFVLLFTFKDVFEDQIEIQRKSLSECFDDFDFRNTDPNTIGPQTTAIVRSFLMEIADSNGYEVYDSLIVLCALFHGDEVNFAMNFIINKFKEEIPSEKEEYVSTYSICTLNTEEVKKVFEKITSDFPSEEQYLEELRLRRHRKFEERKSDGMKEMKRIFPLVIIALTVMSLIFKFVPFRALCYLELSMEVIAVIWCFINYRNKFVCPSSLNTFIILWNEKPPLLIGLIVMVCTFVASVVVATIESISDRQSDVEWIVYIGYPTGMMFMYFVFVSYETFYWFWHQSWTLLWFGIMMITTGLIVDNNVHSVMWIIGIWFVILAGISPYGASHFLRWKLFKIDSKPKGTIDGK